MSKDSNERVKAKKPVAAKQAADHEANSENATQPEADVQNNSKEKKRKIKFRTRKFPIWLRIIVVFILLIISLLLGLIVGYAFFGDGNVTDALKLDTYQHILDIVNKEK